MSPCRNDHSRLAPDVEAVACGGGVQSTKKLHPRFPSTHSKGGKLAGEESLSPGGGGRTDEARAR